MQTVCETCRRPITKGNEVLNKTFCDTCESIYKRFNFRTDMWFGEILEPMSMQEAIQEAVSKKEVARIDCYVFGFPDEMEFECIRVFRYFKPQENGTIVEEEEIVAWGDGVELDDIPIPSAIRDRIADYLRCSREQESILAV